MKATELLLKQHREIEQLFERLRSAEPGEEKGIREELSRLVVAHTVIEQEHFYPALRDAAPEQVLEAIEEHGLAEFELARDLSARAGSDMSARAAVLEEVLLAHIQKEENELFRRAESALTNQELAEIGEVMAHQFDQVRRGPFERILARSLAERMPKLMVRGLTEKTRASAQRGGAKKAAVKRRAAQRGTAQRGTAQRGTQQRGTAQRGTAQRGTAQRGTAQRGTAKRKAAQKAEPARTRQARRGAAGARTQTQRRGTAQQSRTQKTTRSAKSRTAR